MRKSRTLLFVSLFSIMSMSAFAQADTTNGDTSLEKMLETDNKPKTEYVSATFKSTRIINGHSIENVGKGILDFRISHRFGTLNTGAQNFFGLDNATTKLGFDYGVTNWLMVGIGRSTYQKEYDGFVKAKLWRQREHKNLSFSVSYVGGMSIDSRPLSSFSIPAGDTYYFSNRLYYFNQLLIAHKFNNWLSLQVMPTHIHYNLIDSTKDKNDVFAIGVGGRIKLSNRIALTGEYYYTIDPLSTANGSPVHNALAFGIDIETGGHVFQLLFTNSTGISERTFIGQTTDSWSNNGIHFGFNISRVFTVVKPKDFEGSRNKIW